MKFALIDGKKTEPAKGAKGACLNCGADMIAKCGDIKVHHWSHKGIRTCDPWWENETEWHREWKNLFPLSWQEVLHTNASGERHIADVKTDEGWVLEFQHSPIKSDERQARNAFYKKIVWVVDGGRLPSHIKQFQEVLNRCSRIQYGTITLFRAGMDSQSRLLREWSGSRVPIFFDFRETADLRKSRLWFLIPMQSRNAVYLLPFSGADFIGTHNNKGFNEIAYQIIPQINSFLTRQESRTQPIPMLPPQRRTRRL